MRRIARVALPTSTQKALDRKQNDADQLRAAGTLDVERVWKSSRQTKPLKTALGILKTMAGPRERCMYCSDSHGTDIEHFWPKTPHPDRIFRWPNLLLCCTECGRFKGDRFPLDNGAPMLVDPTVDDPWTFLDFDPATGNIVARFDTAVNDWSGRGAKTVERLQLDRREALAASYQKTNRRLVSSVETAIRQDLPDANALAAALQENDDHGLLGWYFRGTGQNVSPFRELRSLHPGVWAICLQTLT
jgi:uncharacterized protein (TIGR02646 family)